MEKDVQNAARAAALRQEAAMMRRAERGQIRAALRTQLADIQRHRQELSLLRLAMRQSIAELRSEARMRRGEPEPDAGANGSNGKP